MVSKYKFITRFCDVNHCSNCRARGIPSGTGCGQVIYCLSSFSAAITE